MTRNEHPPPHNVFSLTFCKQILIVKSGYFHACMQDSLTILLFAVVLQCGSRTLREKKIIDFPSLTFARQRFCPHWTVLNFADYFQIFLEHHGPATVFPQITSFCPFHWKKCHERQVVTLSAHQMSYVRHHSISTLRLFHVKGKLWSYNFNCSAIKITANLNWGYLS